MTRLVDIIGEGRAAHMAADQLAVAARLHLHRDSLGCD